MMQPVQFYIIMVAGLFNLSTTSRIDEGHDLLIKGMDVLAVKLLVSYESHYHCQGEGWHRWVSLLFKDII